MLLPFFVWFGVSIFFAYWGPKHWRGSVDIYSRPKYFINLIL